jgi:hypothetical protein
MTSGFDIRITGKEDLLLISGTVVKSEKIS